MKVFLSWSEEYSNFIPLLYSLLEFHKLPVQMVNQSEQEILPLLGEETEFATPANVLLMVSSSFNSNDTLVKAFKKAENAEVILLAMKPVEIDISSEVVIIPFHQDMLQGFKMLMEYFERNFLLGKHSVVMKDRNRERRDREDRRRADLIQRMRMGFWFTFARLTGAGKFDLVPIRVSTLSKTMEVLAEEIPNYSFEDKKGVKVNCKDALEHAVQKVWGQLRSDDSAKAIILVEMIAEELYNSYTVTQTERRWDDDRRGSAV